MERSIFSSPFHQFLFCYFVCFYFNTIVEGMAARLLSWFVLVVSGSVTSVACLVQLRRWKVHEASCIVARTPPFYKPVLYAKHFCCYFFPLLLSIHPLFVRFQFCSERRDGEIVWKLVLGLILYVFARPLYFFMFCVNRFKSTWRASCIVRIRLILHLLHILPC